MATFEFTSPAGKTYELEGPEGSTKEQAFEKFQEMRPELFGEKKDKSDVMSDKPKQGVSRILQESQEAYKTSPAGRFKETFSPLKAITQEGMVPQLFQYGKRKLAGEAAPKAEEPEDKPVPMMQSLKDMASYARKDPGAFAGHVANAVVADPQFLLMPELLPARLVQTLGRVGKVADAATTAAAQAAGQSAARQLAERGTVDMEVLRQDAKNAAATGGAIRGAGEAARAVAPGVKQYATEAMQKPFEMARNRGYTLPIGEMSPVGAIIDKYYKSPLREVNAQKFYEEVTKPTGTTITEINSKTWPDVEKNLSTQVEKVLQNETVAVPPTVNDTLKPFLPYQKGKIADTLSDIETGQALSGKQWHDIRKELGRRKTEALKEGKAIMASDIGNVIEQWDAYGKAGLSAAAKKGFDDWKKKWTAFSDVDEAVLGNASNYQKYLKGLVEPKDIIDSILKRREAEAREPYGSKARPQTKTAAMASSLGLLGRETIPSNLMNTLPKVAAYVPAKIAQKAMYSAPGQALLYKGVPFTGAAPVLGSSTQKARGQQE
jgi:hypothetical protein